jgi:hypothetical protein
MQTSETVPSANHNSRIFRYISGISLVIIGLIILIDKFKISSWVSWAALSIGALILLANAIITRTNRWIISASLLSGVVIGYVLALGPFLSLNPLGKIGVGLFVFAMSWLLIILLSILINHRTAWWAVIPAASVASLAACFLFTSLRLVDFVLYIAIGLGISFLLWGIFSSLFGLIIPGCLLIGIGPGIYIAWGNLGQTNGLTQTGIMLVWFAVGWGLITIFSRLLNEKFIWWPLIPGGILAVVGCGLYIGGNPSGAATFISNTTAAGLIILGLYLLLLRRGIRR